jgi:hypothetical protein
MAQQLDHVADSRYCTNNNAGRDIHSHYYDSEMGPTSLLPTSLSFNDAPIDLLSSHFTGREEELDRIETVLGVVRGSTPTRFTVYGMPGIGKTNFFIYSVHIQFRVPF